MKAKGQLKNIFLTGEIQVGKSTIVRHVLQNFNGNVSGFETVLDKETKKRQFYIRRLGETGEVKNYIGKMNEMNDKMIPIPTTFEKAGVEILKDCLLRSPDLIIMDELGIFENNAPLFQEYVFKCLNSPIPVLGVLKAKSSRFLNEIKNRDDVVLYTVTRENRNNLKEQIKNMILNN